MIPILTNTMKWAGKWVIIVHFYSIFIHAAQTGKVWYNINEYGSERVSRWLLAHEITLL